MNPPVEDPRETINRKATIVIDHIIQASDVCHTMQHWHIYRKWNEQFFFDHYIIPMAKKLADCGVFGVASDEYLIYAKKNHDEWVAQGEEVVLEMIERIHQK